MSRLISLCLIVALGIPQMTRGKCCCAAERADDDLKPCCRAAIQRLNQPKHRCCRCFASRVESRPMTAGAANRPVTDISSDCDCGRYRMVQSGWRWSPRRDVAEPFELDPLRDVRPYQQLAPDLRRDAFRLQDTPCATGPPLRIWHCVWVI